MICPNPQARASSPTTKTAPAPPAPAARRKPPSPPGGTPEAGRLRERVYLCPKPWQEAILREHLDVNVFLWRIALSKCVWEYLDARERGEKFYPNFVELSRWLTEIKQLPEFARLNAVPRTTLVWTLKRLDLAYKAFFRNTKQNRLEKAKENERKRRARRIARGFLPKDWPWFMSLPAGHPKWKSFNGPKSVDYGCQIKVHESGRYVSIPPARLGWIRMRGWRNEFTGHESQLATLSYDGYGRWELAITVKTASDPDVVAVENPRIMAIDLGLTSFITIFDGSDCEKVENPRHFAAARRNLSRKQRTVNCSYETAKRCPDDHMYRRFTNRHRAKHLVARAHRRVTNQRREFHYKLAVRLVENCDVLIFETLDVKQMLSKKGGRNRSLPFHIHQAGWGQFVSIVEDKMRQAGKRVVKIDQYFASTRKCSSCNELGPKLDVSVRKWACGSCGTEHDRDENAARNIRAEGIRLLSDADKQ